MKKTMVANGILILLALVLASVVTEIMDGAVNYNKYANDHVGYYFIYVFVASIIYFNWVDPSQWVLTNFRNYLGFRQFGIILIIVIAGYYFQRLPDIDLKTKIFLGHRSPITHSFVFIWVTWLLIRKYDLTKWRVVRALYLALCLGITVHMFVDIAYLFSVSITPMLEGHKGHKSIPWIGTKLEIPFLLFMSISALIYTIHLLKGKIRSNLDFNIWRTFSLLRAQLPKTERYFYSALAVMLITNIFTTDYGSGSNKEGKWTFFFGLVMLLLMYLPKPQKKVAEMVDEEEIIA